MAQASIDVDRLLHDTLRGIDGVGWTPACNAYEDEQGFHLEASLPGLRKEDIEIVVERGVLTVKGEGKAPQQDDNRQYFVREIDWGPFSRSFRLPKQVDVDKVAASYQDGLLTLMLPKREEAKPRRIEIG